jgi:hypothetical protein
LKCETINEMIYETIYTMIGTYKVQGE